MIPVIVLLAVVALLIAMAFAGYRDGLYAATYGLTRNLIAFFLAMTFCGPLGTILSSVISTEAPAPQYFHAIAFIGIFGLVLVVARMLKIEYTDPGAGCPIIVDRTAGPIVGLLTAVIFTGSLLVFWSLLPFPKFIPGDQGRLNAKLGAVDTGAIMLKFYSYACNRMPGNTEFLLNNEPRKVDANGEMTAFTDENRNGRWDRGWLWNYEHYADLDASDMPAVVHAGDGDGS